MKGLVPKILGNKGDRKDKLMTIGIDSEKGREKGK